MNIASLWHVSGLVAAFGCLSQIMAVEPLSIDSVRKHMEWGEYDKIVALVEPAVKNKTLPGNNKDASDFLKYLGVAYFADGRIAEARGAFANAYDLNPSVVLEELYVSKEISDFFTVAVTAEKQQIAARGRADSLANAREIDHLSSRYRADFSLATISFALAGILGATSLYEFHVGDSLYGEWNAARKRGDKETSGALKPQIGTADAITETSIVAAAVAVISGTYFTVRARHIRQTKQKLVVKLVSFSVAPRTSISALVEF